MEWIKSKLSRWTAGDYTITEDNTLPDGRPYRLDSFGQNAECFSTLDEAKAIATLKNELDICQADNARLRAELDTRNGRWPDQHQAAQDDGRGIPFTRPAANAQEPAPVESGELAQANGRNGTAPARTDEIPF